MGSLKQKAYTEAVEKENRLRLEWFRKNIDRLEASVETPNTRTVPQELKDELRKMRQTKHERKEIHPILKSDDGPPPKYDERAILHIMKPVEPRVKDILYQAIDRNGGRVRYLTERVKKKPEDRYYFKEVTSYEYGWNMWDETKNKINLGNGRQQVIKASFYRRRGVERDPDWYREPARLSTLICGRL